MSWPRPGAGRPRPRGRARQRVARLRRPALPLRARVPDPQALRLPACCCARRRRWPRRRWTPAWPASPWTWTSTATTSRPSSAAAASSCAGSSRRRSARPKRIVYAEGENERIIRATAMVREEDLAHPILVGRPALIEAAFRRLDLEMDDIASSTSSHDGRLESYAAEVLPPAGPQGCHPRRRPQRDEEPQRLPPP